MAREGLERVTRSAPCAICKKPDFCCRLTRYHWCMRIASPRPHAKGGWLHARDASTQHLPLPPRRRKVSDEELRDRWTPIIENAKKTAIDMLPALAVQLGVSSASLVLLDVGYSENLGGGEPSWLFPERNSRGWIVGITRRLLAPTREGKGKFCVKNSHRGLTYCKDWSKYTGAIWLVEGASDVAAGLTADMCVVGRPSNTGGVDLLVQLLRPFRRRKIVVLGERDRKSSLHVQQVNPSHDPLCVGCALCWPGKYGAVQTSQTLAKRLGRPVNWIFPPVGYKDLREWVSSLSIEELPYHGGTLKEGRFAGAAH